MKIVDAVKSFWSAFTSPRQDTPEDTKLYSMDVSPAYSRPSRITLSRGAEMTILAGLYSRIAMDVASVDIHHVVLNEKGNFKDIVHSELEDRLNLSANMDQVPYSFKLDLVLSLFDEGCIAVVPLIMDDAPNEDGNNDIYSLRVGKITKWFPKDIEVEIYDEKTMRKRQLIVSKNIACIIENPFYQIMNEPNSLVKRINRRLALLDSIDEVAGSAKLDVIIQLPYTIRGETKQKLAEERREALEKQLTGSRYGIGYIDATEHVTQLNRPVDNNILKEIEYLNNQLYGELGMTQSILDGTADSETIVHYENKAVFPVLKVICEGFTRTFLSTAAIKDKHQSIMYFKDLFKHMSIENMADMCDKLSRNEILSSNEIRSGLGYRPDDNPRSDELLNKNIAHDEQTENPEAQKSTKGSKNQNEAKKV